MITYNVDGVKMPKIKKRETTAWIRAVAATYGYKVGEVGYMFVDDEKILEVNNEYLGHDYYTDVITFDYDEPGIVSGDIVISLDTVRTNAEKFGKQYDDELRVRIVMARKVIGQHPVAVVGRILRFPVRLVVRPKAQKSIRQLQRKVGIRLQLDRWIFLLHQGFVRYGVRRFLLFSAA